jgi:hypothetical protein
MVLLGIPEDKTKQYFVFFFVGLFIFCIWVRSNWELINANQALFGAVFGIMGSVIGALVGGFMSLIGSRAGARDSFVFMKEWHAENARDQMRRLLFHTYMSISTAIEHKTDTSFSTLVYDKEWPGKLSLIKELSDTEIKHIIIWIGMLAYIDTLSDGGKRIVSIGEIEQHANIIIHHIKPILEKLYR